MNNSTLAMERLRAANPIPTPDVADEREIAHAVAAVDRAIDGERVGRRTIPDTHGVAPEPPIVRNRRLRPVIAFAAAFVMVVAAVVAAAIIGSNSTVDPADGDTPTTILDLPAPVTTAPPSTSSTVVDGGAPAATRTIGGVSIASGIVFYEDADVTLEMSVYFPAEGDGPWPTIVRYHPFCVTCNSDTVPIGLASRGAVVFSPSWVPEQGTAGGYADGYEFDRAACAVGTAQRLTSHYGGDPGNTVVFGEAGGEHPAAWAGLGIVRTDVCTDPIIQEPTALVIGQMQLIFHQAMFDEAFADPSANARDTLDRFTNPLRWQPAEDLSVLLWVTDYEGNDRSVSPVGTDAWLANRDPSGTLAADLESLGALDDGVIHFSDNAALLEHRMLEAGIDVQLREFSYHASGELGSELLDAVAEFVAALR